MPGSRTTTSFLQSPRAETWRKTSRGRTDRLRFDVPRNQPVEFRTERSDATARIHSANIALSDHAPVHIFLRDTPRTARRHPANIHPHASFLVKEIRQQIKPLQEAAVSSAIPAHPGPAAPPSTAKRWTQQTANAIQEIARHWYAYQSQYINQRKQQLRLLREQYFAAVRDGEDATAFWSQILEYYQHALAYLDRQNKTRSFDVPASALPHALQPDRDKPSPPVTSVRDADGQLLSCPGRGYPRGPL